MAAAIAGSRLIARTRPAGAGEREDAEHTRRDPAQRSTQAFDDAVGLALDLNPTDLRCLDWLTDGPKTAGQLSAGTGLSTAATTTLIDRLERKGFVERVADRSDRRRVLARMTPEGEERIARFYSPLVVEGVALFDDFTIREIEKLTRWLERARGLTDRQRARISEDRAAGSGAPSTP